MQEFVAVIAPAEHRWNVQVNHQRVAQVELQDHEVVAFREMVAEFEGEGGRVTLSNAQNDEGTLVHFVPRNRVLRIV